MGDKQLHGGDVARVRGTPERRRADLVDAGQVEAVTRIPHLLLQARIRIRALVEQRRHHIEIVHSLVEIGARLWIQRFRRPLAVDDGVERRRAVLRGGAWIGAAVEQHPGEIEVAVNCRHEQRAGSIAGADLVDVGAGIHQRSRRVHVALTRGEQQRRHAALAEHQLVELKIAVDARFALGARIEPALLLRLRDGRYLGAVLPARTTAAPRRSAFAPRRRRRSGVPEQNPGKCRRVPANPVQVDRLRHRREIGAAPRQQGDHRGAIGGGGKHDRREPADRFARVRVGAAIEQHADGSRIARGRRKHQRRRAVGGGAVHIGAGGEKRLHHFTVAGAGRKQQRRVAVDSRRRLRIRAGIQQHPHQLGVILLRRPVQRSHSVGLCRIDIGCLLEQPPDRLAITALGGVGDDSRSLAGRHQHRESDGNRRAECAHPVNSNHISLASLEGRDSLLSVAWVQVAPFQMQPRR